MRPCIFVFLPLVVMSASEFLEERLRKYEAEYTDEFKDDAVTIMGSKSSLTVNFVMTEFHPVLQFGLVD